MAVMIDYDGLQQVATEVVSCLQQKNRCLVTAESCTGGLLASVLTSFAGSSSYFERGYVTYANAAKHELLGVPWKVLETYGAVSEQTARAMAEGALARSDSNIALSITGIAGPGGGTEEKPLGTVIFAWSIKTCSGRCEPGKDRTGEDGAEKNEAGKDSAGIEGAGKDKAGNDIETHSVKQLFSGDRQQVRMMAVKFALTHSLQLLGKQT
jgi:nicotinamide-nucleotide amidase